MKSLFLATIVAALTAWPAVAGADAPDVPGDIAVPAGNDLALVAHAVGVQIYACDGTAWTLVAPRANLYNNGGKLIATHFAGPTWQATDGSTVVGKKLKGVNVDPTAIDWLLLSATSSGPGRLAGTTYVQRIHTAGGVPPAASTCTAPGIQAEVPYTADYVFWKAA